MTLDYLGELEIFICKFEMQVLFSRGRILAQTELAHVFIQTYVLPGSYPHGGQHCAATEVQLGS